METISVSSLAFSGQQVSGGEPVGVDVAPCVVPVLVLEKERYDSVLCSFLPRGLCALSWCMSSREEGAVGENRRSGLGATCVDRMLLNIYVSFPSMSCFR